MGAIMAKKSKDVRAGSKCIIGNDLKQTQSISKLAVGEEEESENFVTDVWI